VTEAFKVNSGRNAANPHAEWEKKLAPRVRDRVIDVLKKVDPALVPQGGGNKPGGIKHFHSLAPEAQRAGVAIGSLRGYLNSGHYPQVDEARQEFDHLVSEIIKRTGI
jgi:hypothetical protein